MCCSHLSLFLETPPPRMMRSGQNSLSISHRYLLRRLPHLPQPSFSLSRALLAANSSPSRALERNRCPSSVFGTRWPPVKRAVPSPVPMVTIMTLPLTPLPAPNRISAAPAASASLTTDTRSAPVYWRSSTWMSWPIHDLSMLAAVHTLPWRTAAGKPQPMGPSQSNCDTSLPTVAQIASGVAGCGVSMRRRSASTSPVRMLTGAALHPVPPMSTPRTTCLPG
mmetsp:Transcript_32600/g.103885  ORF Transcript_32600/g.103885 Transcript_32600/m.103885 type:complete len:223 (-) Transcript_32600:254-922(-)